MTTPDLVDELANALRLVTAQLVRVQGEDAPFVATARATLRLAEEFSGERKHAALDQAARLRAARAG